MKTPKEIKEFLNNKVLANINFATKEIINGNTPKVEIISIDDFLEWLENKPKEIVVPDNIKIVEYFTDKEDSILGLVFNEGKQILNHRIEYKCYEVCSCIHSCFDEIKCKLIPFKYEEIKVGDIFFVGELTRINELRFYCIKISEYRYIVPQDEGDIFVNDIDPYDDVYKVVPINN